MALQDVKKVNHVIIYTSLFVKRECLCGISLRRSLFFRLSKTTIYVPYVGTYRWGYVPNLYVNLIWIITSLFKCQVHLSYFQQWVSFKIYMCYDMANFRSIVLIINRFWRHILKCVTKRVRWVRQVYLNEICGKFKPVISYRKKYIWQGQNDH